jgi:hypothetical protein
MDRFTIHPVTHESALGMLSALSGFHAELLESEDGWEIVVTLGVDGRGDREIVAVLNRLAEHVKERSGGPTRGATKRAYLRHGSGVGAMRSR